MAKVLSQALGGKSETKEANSFVEAEANFAKVFGK